MRATHRSTTMVRGPARTRPGEADMNQHRRPHRHPVRAAQPGRTRHRVDHPGRSLAARLHRRRCRSRPAVPARHPGAGRFRRGARALARSRARRALDPAGRDPSARDHRAPDRQCLARPAPLRRVHGDRAGRGIRHPRRDGVPADRLPVPARHRGDLCRQRHDPDRDASDHERRPVRRSGRARHPPLPVHRRRLDRRPRSARHPARRASSSTTRRSRSRKGRWMPRPTFAAAAGSATSISTWPTARSRATSTVWCGRA